MNIDIRSAIHGELLSMTTRIGFLSEATEALMNGRTVNDAREIMTGVWGLLSTLESIHRDMKQFTDAVEWLPKNVGVSIETESNVGRHYRWLAETIEKEYDRERAAEKSLAETNQ